MTTDPPNPDRRAERGLLRRLGGPVLAYFDHRFAELRDELARRTDALDARLPAPDELAALRTSLRDTRAELEQQRRALVELATSVEHFARAYAERADDVAAAYEQLAAAGERSHREPDPSA